MCRLGTSWVQENILTANPEADLDVYVVWEPMLGARRDDAEEVTALMPDPRARHYWNDEFLIGDHYSDAAFGRTAWDIYFLYGPEAVWQETPPEPLIVSGYTIYHQRQQLQEAFAGLFVEPGQE